MLLLLALPSVLYLSSLTVSCHIEAQRPCVLRLVQKKSTAGVWAMKYSNEL